ncbi:potassium-transporting ATPase subunit KdpC [Caulobacter sp. KR2-114]|uniref:potassium-transporting ATPase subunit KdpC n=1 Tax=Caulobacter sp. KR2-114 TaxID=3400912 RepID=UPI003BFD0D27
MLSQLRPAIVSTVFFTVLLGLGYPLAITGVAQAAFPDQAGGSLIRDAKGQVIGSALIGQAFAKPEYLHPRPSAAGSNGYDASASSGSNYGPLNPDLAKRIKGDATSLAGEGKGAIPADALTSSASGLDPDVSPANAARQAARIAAARGIDVAKVQAVIDAHTDGPTLGFLGQAHVNVLKTNLALDAALGKAHPSGK